MCSSKSGRWEYTLVVERAVFAGASLVEFVVLCKCQEAALEILEEAGGRCGIASLAAKTRARLLRARCDAGCVYRLCL